MAGSMDQKETEALENDLIERMTFQIASCRTDEEFEASLQKNLGLLVSKLSTKHESVRTKILELLVHINKRVKSRPKIQLPISQLLFSYQDPSATAFVNNFTIIYLKIGFPRLSTSQQLELLPMIFSSLEGKPTTQQDALLLLALPLLPYVKIPNDAAACKNLFNFAEKPDAARLFLEIAYDALLMPYAIAKPEDNAPVVTPPGLSQYAVKRILSSEEPFGPEKFEQIKCALVKLLSCGMFSATKIAVHLLIASSDSRHSVATVGDNELRRLSSSIDWDNTELHQKLYDLFLGTIVPKDQSKCTIRPEHRRTASHTRVRLKIIPLLIKSPVSASLLIPSIQTIFEALNGAETKPNLRIKGLSLVQHFSSHCSPTAFPAVAPVLLSEMKKLAFQTNPIESEDRNSAMVIRNMSLAAIPKILLKCPSLFSKNLDLVTSLIDLLKSQDIGRDTEFRSSVKSTLLDLMHVVKGHEDNKQQMNVLEQVILSYFQDEWPEVREVVCRYASFLFSSKHVPSKFVLLMASADTHTEVRKIASDYLDSDIKELPLFSEIMPYIKVKLSKMRSVNVTAEMIFYVRRCLNVQLQTLAKESDTGLKAFASFVVTAFSQKEQDATLWDSIELYIEWVKDAVISKKSLGSKVSTDKDTTFYLLEMLSVLPAEAIRAVIPKPENSLDTIYKASLMETGEESQDNLCQVMALIVRSCYSEETRTKYVADSLQTSESKTASVTEKVVKSRVALYVLMDAPNLDTESLSKLVSNAVSYISSKNLDSSLKITGCKIIGEIAKYVDISTITTTDLKEPLVSCISPQNLHLSEAATLGLGFLCVGLPFNRDIYRGCLDLILTKGVDIMEVPFHFILADAVCCVLLQSPLEYERLIRKLKPRKHEYFTWQREETERFVNLVLEKYTTHPKRSIRTSSCIWILCILKNCGMFLQNCTNMIQIQERLLRLLGEKEPKTEDKKQKTNVSLTDILEDITPKCLKLLYDNASDEQKSELTKDLSIIFSLTEKEASEVTSGSSAMVAMKEVFILVTECTGKPELFYEFVDVISFRLWGSGTKAKEFFQSKSFETTFKQLVEPFKSKLIPKLFVGINDPTPATRNYLTSIWITLFSGTAKAKIINENLSIILKEITCNLEDSLWKLRQSACVALSEVFSLGSGVLKDNLELLIPLYERCFKVVDDMKETVRAKAELALKSLFKVTIDLCDSSIVGTTTSEKTLSLVLPILIKTGLSSPADIVRKSSLKALISITETASSSLKPHLHILIPNLLESLSAFENQTVNYLSVRLEGEHELHEKLDTVRISSIYSSPVFNALKQCIPHMDAEVMEKLAPSLCEIIDSSVGLCTKAGACLLLVQLVDQCPQVVRSSSEKFMRSLLKNLSNRNVTVQKTCADTLGHVMKLVPDDTVENLITKYRDQYLNDDSPKSRQMIATLMSSLGKRCPDVIRKHATIILPLAFYAMHEVKEEQQASSTDNKPTSGPAAAFEELWSDFSPSTENGLKLYLKEIIEYICRGFDSRLWIVKKQAANCLVALIEKINDPIDIKLAISLIDMLTSNLPGRTWDGKENVLKALEVVIKRHKDLLIQLSIKGEFDCKKVTDLCLKECRKENPIYKESAITSTSKIINCVDTDRFSDFYNEILKPTVISCVESKNEEETEAVGPKKKHSLLLSCVNAIKSFCEDNQTMNDETHKDCVDLLHQVYTNGTYNVKVEAIKALVVVVERCGNEKEHVLTIFEHCGNLIEDLLNTTRYPDLQSLGLQLTEAFVQKVNSMSKAVLTERPRIVQGIEMISSESSSPALRDKAEALSVSLRNL